MYSHTHEINATLKRCHKAHKAKRRGAGLETEVVNCGVSSPGCSLRPDMIGFDMCISK